ncbi:PAS domain-containing protein, partial [Acinetobacter baumannii]
NTVITRNDGTVQYVIAMGIDVTEQRHAERELLETKEQYELAVAGSSDSIYDWEIATNKVYISPRIKEILGYEDHELANEMATLESLTLP